MRELINGITQLIADAQDLLLSTDFQVGSAEQHLDETTRAAAIKLQETLKLFDGDFKAIDYKPVAEKPIGEDDVYRWWMRNRNSYFSFEEFLAVQSTKRMLPGRINA